MGTDQSRFNVIWDSPSTDATGQMPLGNRDIVAGLYAIENDALVLLLSKNDACPDFDHFGSGTTALLRMLVQDAYGKILLLPIWPVPWDIDFKLHLSENTIVQGKVKDGKLKAWTIKPESRKKDVIVYQPQK